MPKPPRPSERQELYSVVMRDVAVQDLLFALARDAKLNIDIHPAITGTVTMNVSDQTLVEILDRVARQVDLRFDINGKNLSIQPDLPYLKNYRIDYPNIARNSTSAIGSSSSVGGGSTSSSSIDNTSSNKFWDTLKTNLIDLLRETDKVVQEGGTASAATAAQAVALTPRPATSAPASGGAATGNQVTAATAAAAAAAAQLQAANAAAVQPSAAVPRSIFREAASVIVNAETGNISVRATQSQHTKVRDFVDRVLSSARRQVLLEATIVEVDLSSQYQQGINWSILQTGGANAGSGISINQGNAVSSLAELTFKQFRLWNGDADLSAMLRMLESFGTLRVLSSPKISVLNNQSSILKVVDNKVYFTVTTTPGTAATATTPATATTYSTAATTVPIGFLMAVIPQISEGHEITLNLRPTITRITGFVNDPNPDLAKAGVSNRVPEVQTREMESMMRVQSGDIAILGGLMQDSRDNTSNEIPGLNNLPSIGNLFKYRNETSKKSELVIFLRPTVLSDASLSGDFRDYRGNLPTALDDGRSGGGLITWPPAKMAP
ncbi:MAG: type II and III secretion system protein [Burkholderiales bacterium]|nr:type II and III secretion system protein [Burkholderiales bacterium]